MIFSVVIPSHKRKNLLRKLLQSLELQQLDRSQFEVIVVATEKDEAFDLEKENWNLNIGFTFIPNDKTQGRSASAKRNFGAKQAQASWIAFTDDDCLADENWLQEAEKQIFSSSVDFMEGHVHIPVPEKKTFTYKGIQRLSRSGGFQTCNMFYKKKDFLELGGFDPNFPYYLEDTDLGWTFKEANKSYAYLPKSIVSHPVPPGVPKKMLESAFRMEKLPYLYKKHTTLFKESKMRALPRPYIILSFLDLPLIAFLFIDLRMVLIFLSIKLLLSLFLLIRMLKGCATTAWEVLMMYYYLLICPLISLIWLIKGNLKQRVWIFLK